MSAYKNGQHVLIRAEVVEHHEGVGVLALLYSKTDEYRAWIREDLVTAGIALDLGDSVPAVVVDVLRTAAFYRLADQVEKQTTVPHMDEPGRYGVVADRAGEHWTNGGPSQAGFPPWMSLRTGLRAHWDEINDPTPIRPGEDDE